MQCAGPLTDGQIAEIRRKASQGNHMVIGVYGDGDDSPFAYTTGLAEVDLPELIVTGNDGRVVTPLINALADRMRREGSFEHGQVVDLGGAFPVVILEVVESVKETHTVQAGRVHGDEGYRVLQVLIADKQGRFPNDPGYDFWPQPILSDKPMPSTSAKPM